MRRPASALLVALFACACSSVPLDDPEGLTAYAEELTRSSLLVDTHVDLPVRLVGQEDAPDDVSRRTEGGHFDYVRAREGGLDAPFMSIYVPAGYQESGGARDFADRLIDLVEGLCEQHPGKFEMAATTADVRRIFAAGKVAFPMGIENGAAIEDELANLAHFHARGVRYITLCHSKANLICDSSYDEERPWGGLSPFGREVVAEMNRLGILVDVSHVSDAAFDDVIEASAVPVIASHSSCEHFVPGFERNLDDGRIRALAANGGVIQINFGSAFVDPLVNGQAFGSRAEIARLLAEAGVERDSDAGREIVRSYREANPPAEARLEQVADHIDHVVSLVGIDHVGIGSDYDGVSAVPVGLEDVSTYPALVAELLRRGHSPADVRKVLGGNVMRVWAAAEAHAAKASRP